MTCEPPLVPPGTLREQQHQPLRASIEDTLQWRRIGLGIEPFWTIDVRVLCPEDMPESEAYIYWHAEVWYARLCIRCDVPPILLDWLLVHELIELRRWRTTDVIRELLTSARVWSRISSTSATGDFLEPLWDRYDQQIREVRNQEVEIDTLNYFDGDRRPLHLDGAYVYSNLHGPLNRVHPPTMSEQEAVAPPSSYMTQPLPVRDDGEQSDTFLSSDIEPEPVFPGTALTVSELDRLTDTLDKNKPGWRMIYPHLLSLQTQEKPYQDGQEQKEHYDE